MPKMNQKDYTHYVVVSHGGAAKIDSGWSFVEDAKDRAREVNNAKVATKRYLKSQGFDPDVNANWIGGAESMRPGYHKNPEYRMTLHSSDAGPRKKFKRIRAVSRSAAISKALREVDRRWPDAHETYAAIRKSSNAVRRGKTSGKSVTIRKVNKKDMADWLRGVQKLSGRKTPKGLKKSKKSDIWKKR
jgi:hypothetical protein